MREREPESRLYKYLLLTAGCRDGMACCATSSSALRFFPSIFWPFSQPTFLQVSDDVRLVSFAGSGSSKLSSFPLWQPCQIPALVSDWGERVLPQTSKQRKKVWRCKGVGPLNLNPIPCFLCACVRACVDCWVVSTQTEILRSSYPQMDIFLVVFFDLRLLSSSWLSWPSEAFARLLWFSSPSTGTENYRSVLSGIDTRIISSPFHCKSIIIVEDLGVWSWTSHRNTEKQSFVDSCVRCTRQDFFPPRQPGDWSYHTRGRALGLSNLFSGASSSQTPAAIP